MNFVQCGWLDGFELAASLRQRLHLFPAPDEHGCRILDLRWNDGKWKAHPETKRWAELTNTLSRIRRMGEHLAVEHGRIWLEMLDPGALRPWEPTTVTAVFYPLRTNPACVRYCGLEQLHLLPGTLTLVSPHPMSSAVNLGEWSVVHLAIEITSKTDP